MKMAESTVEMTLTEIKVLLGNVLLIENKLKDISSKESSGFEGKEYSICKDIDALREVIGEMRSMLKAAMKGSETNGKG